MARMPRPSTSGTRRAPTKTGAHDVFGLVLAAAKALPDTGFILDREGRCLEILGSSDVHHLLPAPPEHLRGQRLHDVLPKDSAELFVSVIERTLTTHAPQIVEYELSVQAGQRWFEARTTVLDTASGTTDAVLWLARDMSDRKRTERQLWEGQAYLRAIADAIPGAVYQYMLTPGGEQHFLYMSRGIEPLLEMGADEVVKDFSRAWRLTHPDDVEELWASIEQSARTLQPWTHEFRVVVGGRVKWLRGSSIPEGVRPDGSIVWNGILLDATDQKHAEDTIKKLQRRHELLLHSVAEGVYGLDRHGLTTFVNPAAARMLGYEPHELIGQDMHRTIHHSRADGSVFPPTECPILETLHDGEPRFVSLDVMWKKDNSPLEVEYTVTSIRDHNRLNGCVITFRDISDRRRAEMALRESHERFELVSRATNDAIWDWDAQTDRTWWNPYVYELLGYDPERTVPSYEAWQARLHAEDRPRVVGDFEAALASGAVVWSSEYRYTRGDGAYRHAMDRALMQYGPDGQPTRLVGAMTDITERKLAEEALRFTQFATDRAADAILWVTSEAEFVYVNDAACAALEYSREELVGKRVSDIDPDYPLARWPETWDRVRRERSFVLESRHRTKSGRIYPVEIRVNFLRYGGREYICCFVQDITERKRVERFLRDQTAQLQTITDSMSSYLLTGDWRQASAHIVRTALELTASVYGFVGAVVEGPILRVLAHEGMTWDQTENRAFYDAAVRAYEQNGYLEFRNLDNLFGRVITDGEAVLSNEPLTDPRSGGLPSGHPPLHAFLGVPIRRGLEVVGLIGIANKPGGYAPEDEAKLRVLADTAGVLYENYRQRQRAAGLESARQRAEADLREAQRRLLERQRLEKEQVEAELDKTRETLIRQTRLAALGQLSGSVAHELRNPLGSIRNALYLLKRRLPSEDRKSDAYLRMAEEEVETANRTIQDLLALSSGQEAVKEEVDLTRLIERAFDRARPPESVTWQADLTPIPFLVRADSVQLRQVLVNLIQNAMQAMEGRGHIQVQASRSSTHDVMTIRDSGPGIPEPIAARLFEPLFTTKAKGTGLGLTICRQIIERHGGTIECASLPDGGAMFTILLPLERAGR